VPYAETTLGNCGRYMQASYMLLIYGLVALTMLKPAKERAWLEKKTKSRYDTVFDAMLVYLTKHLSQRTNTKK